MHNASTMSFNIKSVFSTHLRLVKGEILEPTIKFQNLILAFVHAPEEHKDISLVQGIVKEIS